jgi:hypothetical protein
MIGRNIISTIIQPPTPVFISQGCNSNICSHTYACVGVKPADCAMWSQQFRVTWLQLIVMKAQRQVMFITSRCAVKYKNGKST